MCDVPPFFLNFLAPMFGYLYARLKFGWTTLQYSAYLSVSSAFTAFGIIIVLPLLIRYKSQKASPPVLQYTVGGFLLMIKPQKQTIFSYISFSLSASAFMTVPSV